MSKRVINISVSSTEAKDIDFRGCVAESTPDRWREAVDNVKGACLAAFVHQSKIPDIIEFHVWHSCDVRKVVSAPGVYLCSRCREKNQGNQP